MVAPEPQRGPDHEPDRLEAFSDGVLAVIITIMALELKAPIGGTVHDLGKSMPGLLVYILSFTVIGIYWNNHHHLLRATSRIGGAVMWANLHLLFWLSLIPVLTEWLRRDYRSNLPASAYGGVALGAAFAYAFLVRAIVRHNGPGSQVALAVGSDFKGWMSIVLYALGVGLAWVTPWISYGLYVAVAVIWIVPDRRFARGDAAP